MKRPFLPTFRDTESPSSTPQAFQCRVLAMRLSAQVSFLFPLPVAPV